MPSPARRLAFNRRAHLLGRVFRPPVGVFHDEGTRPAQNLMVNKIGGADRESPASPAAGCTKICSNGVSSKIFPLATQLNATPPARHTAFCFVSACKSAQHAEENFLQARLQRGRAIAMNSFRRARQDRARGRAAWPCNRKTSRQSREFFRNRSRSFPVRCDGARKYSRPRRNPTPPLVRTMRRNSSR